MNIRIKESTYARYYNLIFMPIVPVLGAIKIEKLDSRQLNQFVEEKSTNGRIDGKGGLSPKTINDLLSLLFQVIRYAEKKNYIMNFDYDIIQPKQQSEELPVLSVLEQNKLVKYIENSIDVYNVGVLLLSSPAYV